MLLTNHYNKKFALGFLAAGLLLLASMGRAYADEKFQSSLKIFLSEVPALSSATDAIIKNLKFLENNKAISITKHDEFLCSLAAYSVPDDSEADVRSELMSMTQNRALFEAQMRLAFYIGQGGIDRKLFIYDDGLGTALLAYYQSEIKNKKLKGIETAASVLDGEKFAVGLAWISSDTSENISANVPAYGALDDDYCRFLYKNRALILFEAGRYEEALPVFKNIHDFKWADVNAYLDASECFLRTGYSDDCKKLLTELILTLGEKMTSKNFQRAGKLFREAGDKDAAKNAFISARKKFHEENKLGIRSF